MEEGIVKIEGDESDQDKSPELTPRGRTQPSRSVKTDKYSDQENWYTQLEFRDLKALYIHLFEVDENEKFKTKHIHQDLEALFKDNPELSEVLRKIIIRDRNFDSLKHLRVKRREAITKEPDNNEGEPNSNESEGEEEYLSESDEDSGTKMSNVKKGDMGRQEARAEKFKPGMNINIWIDNFEFLAERNGWDEDDMKRELLTSLTGSAFVIVRGNWQEGKIKCYKDARKVLLDRFQRSEKVVEIELAERKWRAGDDTNSYYSDVIALCKEYDPTMPVEKMINKVIAGLPRQHRRIAAIAQPKNLEQLQSALSVVDWTQKMDDQEDKEKNMLKAAKENNVNSKKKSESVNNVNKSKSNNNNKPKKSNRGGNQGGFGNQGQRNPGWGQNRNWGGRGGRGRGAYGGGNFNGGFNQFNGYNNGYQNNFGYQNPNGYQNWNQNWGQGWAPNGAPNWNPNGNWGPNMRGNRGGNRGGRGWNNTNNFNSNNNNNNTNNNNTGPPKCHSCGQDGHFKNQCPGVKN